MSRREKSVQAIADQRLDAAAHASTASADLQLDLVDEDGQLLARFGGQWDRQLRAYVGDADTSRVIRLHPGQVDAAVYFDDWLAGHIAGDVPPDQRIFDIIFSGGRRGGKTALAMAVMVGYALAVPGSITWCVCPSDAFFAEPQEYLRSIMPADWYSELGFPHWTFFLPNGSVIVMRSGHTARQQKKGRCDFAVIQEGQAVPNQSYETLSASIVDKGGLVLTTANPPDVGDPGGWVADLVTAIETGQRADAEHFFFDPLRNPHIDHVALQALRHKMDAHTYDVQVRGKFLLPPDSVLHAWDRTENEMPVPEVGGRDVTRAFTQRFEGRGYDDVIGMDVQNFPWIAAVRCRFYANPKAPDDLDEVLLWGVGESYIEQGDEVDCARDLEDQRCSHDGTLIVADASCEWQQQQRDQKLQRPKYAGRGSADMLRGEGFRHVVPPDQDMKRNPHVHERVRAANSRIGTQAGDRRVFIDPERCPKTAMSVRRWRTNKSGQVGRNSRFAHGGDALTYVIWRFFPRRADTRDNVDVKAIKRFGGRSRLKGF